MQDIKALFDIGNGRIKWAIIAQEEWKATLLAKEIIKTKWLRKGKVLDPEEVANTLNELVEHFIKKLWGDFIEEVIVGISHPEMQIQRLSESKRVMNETIWQDDLDHLSKVIGDLRDKHNVEVLKILPVYRTIDDEKKEKNPLGLQWRKLEITADIFMLSKTFYASLLDVFQKVWLNVVDIIPNILATAEAACDGDQRDLWVLLIDIGNNQTSFAVYEDSYAVTYGVLPVWWEEVTKDISIGMQIDIREAEQFKKEYGEIITEDQKPHISWDEPLDKSYLAEVITARYEQIFQRIQKHLQKLWKDWRLPGGVLLTGGWSKVHGLDLLSKQIFKLATFYAKDNNLYIWDLSNNQQFITTLWLYTRAQKYNETKSWLFNFSGGWASLFDPIKKLFKKVF